MGIVEEWAGERRDYVRILGQFLEHCGKEAQEVRTEDLRAWKEWLEAEEYAASTIRTYLATVASFYDSLCERGLAESNPVRSELLPKTMPYASGRYLSEEEEAKLLGAIDVETEWGRRDYALILLLVRSGRRVGEALGLRWGDFEVGRDGVWYEWRDERKKRADGREKDEVQRRARLDWEVWMAICAHLEGCGRLETMQDEEVIFTPLSDICGRVERLHGKDWHKQALAKENIGRMIQMYVRWAGLRAEEITPKALRYTALMRRRQAGCGLEEIRRDLGYGSLDAVRLALKHVEMQEVD